MSLSEVTVEGTLQPDGTLSLDTKPDLPAGRVRVLLQKVPTEIPAESWWDFMQRTRRELDERKAPMMEDVEMQEYVDSLRQDDDRIDAIYRELEEERRRQEKPGC